MADESDAKKGEGKEGDKAPAKKSKKKLIIIIGAVVLVLVLGGGGYLFLSGGGDDEAADAHGEVAEEDDGHGGKKKVKTDEHGEIISDEPEILEFNPFIVNLTNTAGNRYLKVTINIELEPEAAEESRGKTAQIRDSIITLLSSKSYADVGSVSGKYQLRDEIAARINLIISEGKVKSVYFTEFVIQ
ncbi:MAG: flagellar basal body-associated FliL family protein [Proteobacteria bacterium]|nr:flagellar basal body-associated FliL family protein [Pseudomonadota bacterium]